MKEHENLVNDMYKDGSFIIHGIFIGQQGEKALRFLEDLFCSAHFDHNCPRDRALYQQGQANTIYEIKDMISKVNSEYYNN